MSTTYRSKKVASLLKEVISEIILYELNDPVFKNFISLTEVKIGNDLKKATVYFRAFGKDNKEIEKALNKAKGYIKRLLAQKITLKFIPDIEFKIDLREEKEKELAELLAKISKSRY